MNQIPKETRAQFKELISKLVETKFKDLTLLIKRQGNRLVAVTLQGNLAGYVQKGHEERQVRRQAWTIEWAVAVDGNVSAIVQPCMAEGGGAESIAILVAKAGASPFDSKKAHLPIQSRNPKPSSLPKLSRRTTQATLSKKAPQFGALFFCRP